MEEGVGSGSEACSSLIETVLGTITGRECDPIDDLLLLREEEILAPPCFEESSFTSFSSISNTPVSGTRLNTRSGCMRVGEAEWEIRDCVGDAVGVRFIVEEKSQESAIGTETIDGCFRRSWRSTRGGRPTGIESVTIHVEQRGPLPINVDTR